MKVVDVGRPTSGSPYIVMELLEGQDLSALVERGPLPIDDAVDYILQACEAVAEAHALGIVHRDLEPRNMFLTAKLHGRAHVKVLDFGLAKRVDMQDRALTATAAVMGSPQYMSPEQMKASRVASRPSPSSRMPSSLLLRYTRGARPNASRPCSAACNRREAATPRCGG